MESNDPQLPRTFDSNIRYGADRNHKAIKELTNK
jgi:hypothetical protein